MYFDAELVPYCGGVYRVKARVESFLDEKTGRMSTMKTPAVHARRRLVPVPLQQLPNVLPEKYLFVVA